MLTIEKGIDNKVLRAISLEVEQNELVSGAYKDLVQQMKLEIDSPEQGKITLGIAAPQIGINKRLIVVREILESTRRGEILKDKIYEMINPVITYKSEHTNYDYEGCLSVPGVEDKVDRASQIKVIFTTLDGKQIEREYVGLNARVIQHEVDHLDGILFTDYIGGRQFVY